jgi:aminoglycoside 6-adenylyltransferase
MRSEEEMVERILNIAQNDERIRAVSLNGSRANPNARRDIFQDFDIVYMVTDVDAFKSDSAWIQQYSSIYRLRPFSSPSLRPNMSDCCLHHHRTQPGSLQQPLHL